MSDTKQEHNWQNKRDPLIPPERFANLFRDAGIDSIETYLSAMHMTLEDLAEQAGKTAQTAPEKDGREREKNRAEQADS